MSFAAVKVPQNRAQKHHLKLSIPSAQPNGVVYGNGQLTDDDRFSSEVLATLDSATSVQSTPMDSMSQHDWQTAARQGEIVKLNRIGEGSGGSVSLCQLRNHSSVFALKEITANPNMELQKQVLRELQVNRTCDSPYIVRYYGAYLLDEVGSIFIAMEYCEGRSLDAVAKQIKRRGGRIGERVLSRIAQGVLEGISYLYDRNVLHRDIKPQNILLDSAGQVKLCDFGVSGQVVNSLATTFTGTSYYMAPERIQGQPYSVTSDVWSLGLTLLELAQGRFPFSCGPRDGDILMPIELLNQIVKMPSPELLDEPEAGIVWSASFRHFLHSCLEKDLSKRPSPFQLLSHPWIAGNLKKPVRMDKFVREAWGDMLSLT